MIEHKDGISKMQPEELLEFLQEHFTYEVPIGIESEMAMRKAGNLLGTLTNAYSYLASVHASLSIYAKQAKSKIPEKPKKGEDAFWYDKAKEDSENMALRRNIVETFCDIIKQQYNCVSRMITVKTKADEELKMSDAR